jgi:ribosomal protein S18 acetylase RimI-like enzyme
VESIFKEEMDFLKSRYYWDNEYSYLNKTQLLRFKRLQGFLALDDKDVIGILFWYEDEHEISIAGYYFRGKDDSLEETEFLRFCITYLLHNYEGYEINAQLIKLNTSAKADLFKSFGFETVKRNYMLATHENIVIDEYEDSWILHPLAESPNRIPNILDELAYSMYRSYNETIDARVMESFSSIEGCRKFLYNLFEYPVYGEVDYSLSKYAKDMHGAIIGMIIIARSREDTGNILQISVVPWYQGHGLGRTLMHDAINSMSMRKIDKSVLMVTARNERAVKLYLSLGYRTIADFYAVSYKKRPS